MSTMDWVGLIASFAYAFGILAFFETLGKKRKLPQFVTRKLTHIFAGLWTWGILILFDHQLPGLVPFATFIILNYLFYRKQTYSHMDSSESSPGTVYFAISITLCFALFWRPNGPVDHISLGLAAIMAMTIGDALAALIGKYFGTRTFRIWNVAKTIKGTVAMFISSSIVIFLCLWLVPASVLAPFEPPHSFYPFLYASIIGGIAAAAIEAVSPKGLDNLTVPLGTASILYLLLL